MKMDEKRLIQRYETVRTRIARVAERAGRSPGEITLVAVTKNVPAELIRQAAGLGMKHFGENRAQELREKYQHLTHLRVTWHFIGRIQTNKVKYFVPICQYVHSVWRVNEVMEIQKRAERLDKTIYVFVEVNTSGEESKAGLQPDQVKAFLSQVLPYDRLRFIGLMTMAPLTREKSVIRASFRTLRELRDHLEQYNKGNVEIRELSMGMSNDFEIAIEEGATYLRIGSAIFKSE